MDFVQFADPSNRTVLEYAPSIRKAAAGAVVPSCALAAIVEVESGGANIFQHGIAPGPGCGVGLCQITYGVDWSNPERPRWGEAYDLFAPPENLACAAREFLSPALRSSLLFRELYPEEFTYYGNGQVLYYAFGIYNAGATAIETALKEGSDPDRRTTDRYASRAYQTYARMIVSSHAQGL